jgi:hypothetical protein
VRDIVYGFDLNSEKTTRDSLEKRNNNAESNAVATGNYSFLKIEYFRGNDFRKCHTIEFHPLGVVVANALQLTPGGNRK